MSSTRNSSTDSTVGPGATVSPELKTLLRKVKLGKALDTLPERLALAKTRQLGHAEFLELVLADGSPAVTPPARCCEPAAPDWTPP